MYSFFPLRVPRWLIILILVLLVLFAGLYCAVGWYFSGKLFEMKTQVVDFDQTVQRVAGQEYTIQGNAYDIDGIVGGVREDKSTIGIFDAPSNLSKVDKVSTRTLQSLTGAQPKQGDKISLQGNIWITDPKQALGIDFQDVIYTSPVGDMNAWLISGQNPASWTIAVHGIGADKNEMLRYVKPVLASGNTMLIINYRGDAGNPPSPDGRNHFGDTEWQDVAAAVRYAKTQGATTVNFYGSSLGGSLVQNYLRHTAHAPIVPVGRVVLDSPALNWDEILQFRVKKMGYPTIVVSPGKTFAALRAGINFKRATTYPGSIMHPTLIIHNKDDNSVPQSGSVRVAAAQPNLVTFMDFGSGGHIRAWNHDPIGYEALVTTFLLGKKQ